MKSKLILFMSLYVGFSCSAAYTSRLSNGTLNPSDEQYLKRAIENSNLVLIQKILAPKALFDQALLINIFESRFLVVDTNNPEVVEFFLQNGINVLGKGSKYEKTVLEYAIDKWYEFREDRAKNNCAREIVLLLLKYGADIYEEFNAQAQGLTLLNIAEKYAEQGFKEPLELLINEEKKRFSPEPNKKMVERIFEKYLKSGDKDLLIDLIKIFNMHPEFVNKKMQFDLGLHITPLDYAIMKHNFELVKILLIFGAEPFNLNGLTGRSSLYSAIVELLCLRDKPEFFSAYQIVGILLDFGADFNNQKNECFSHFSCSTFKENETVKEFAERLAKQRNFLEPLALIIEEFEHRSKKIQNVERFFLRIWQRDQKIKIADHYSKLIAASRPIIAAEICAEILREPLPDELVDIVQSYIGSGNCNKINRKLQ